MTEIAWSQRAHERLGFSETDRLVAYRKEL
jgi:hypothetical protein